MERDDFYAAIVRNSSDAIVSHDFEGKVTSWNLGAEFLTGFTAEEMKGQHINKLFSDEDRLTYWRQVSKLAVSERQLPFELQLQSASGAPKVVSITVSPFGMDGDKQSSISLIARDISRQKEAEDHINELYATVSHELRTPLTSLRGSLSILDEGLVPLDSKDGKDMVKVARQGADRLLRIVTDILDFRRLESAKTPVHLSVVKTEDIIDQGILQLRSLSEKLNVQIVKAVAEETHVSADKELIIQVMANLLSNAIKHSNPESQVQVLAVLRRSGVVRLSVIDNGPGISEENKKNIFQKFHRIDPSSTRSLQGTGLGLAMCKLIVEKHGGTIGFDSTEGRGTSFWFELKSIGSSSSRHAGTVITPAAKQALIISSNNTTVQALHKRLTHGGIGCLLIPPEEVLAVVESQKPHAVILDLSVVGPHIFKLVKDIRDLNEETRTIVFRCNAGDGTFSQPADMKNDNVQDLSPEEETKKVLGLKERELKCCLNQEDFLEKTMERLK